MRLIPALTITVAVFIFASCSKQDTQDPKAGTSKGQRVESNNASLADNSKPSETNVISVNTDPELVLRPFKLSRAERTGLIAHPEAFLVCAIDIEEKSETSNLSLHTKAGDCIALWLDNNRTYGGDEIVKINWMVPKARRKALNKLLGEVEDKMTFVLLVPLSGGGGQFWFTYADKNDFLKNSSGQFDIKTPPSSGATGVIGGGNVLLFLVTPSRTSNILPIKLGL